MDAGDDAMNLLEFRGRLRYPTGFQVDAAFHTAAQVTGLVGPSGSGKTSILSMIAGMRRPDEGRIRLGSRVLFDSEQKINLRPEARRIGYVPQDHLLFPHLTVKQNLLYGRNRRHTIAVPLTFERVAEVLELTDYLNRYPHTLSGGQRQRVALGRALLSGPELLLLDEPLPSVDDSLKHRVLDCIEDVLHNWPIPTLYVTHNSAELQRIATQVIHVHQGRVTGNESGSPAVQEKASKP
jgi:molybdate transport system ATP-binding protein